MRKITKNGVALLAGTLALAAFAGLAQAETRFAVQDSTGTVDKMVVTDTGNIGIGTSNPTMAIFIEKSGVTGDTSMMFHNSGVLPYNQYNSPSFFFMRNNDASVNSGWPENGDRLGSMSFGSMFPAYKYGANISAFAKGNWTATSFPGYLSFQTTGAANTSPAERMKIDPEGNIGIGISTPTQKLEVNGAIRLNTTTVKPATCNSSVRGVIWLTQGATGVADALEVCVKDATNNYAWVKIN